MPLEFSRRVELFTACKTDQSITRIYKAMETKASGGIWLSSVRSSIVAFRSAKARSFRGAKDDYRTVIPRTILTSRRMGTLTRQSFCDGQE
jgi:hypothetical protein